VRQELPAAQKSRHYDPQNSGLFYRHYCIENHKELLHCDRGFDPFEQHLGLQVKGSLDAF
jgi:hypothetical protein